MAPTTTTSSIAATAVKDRDPCATLNTILQRLGEDPPKFHIVETKTYHVSLELGPGATDRLASSGHVFALSRLATICKGRKSTDCKKVKRTIAGEACELLETLLSEQSRRGSGGGGRRGTKRKVIAAADSIAAHRHEQQLPSSPPPFPTRRLNTRSDKLFVTDSDTNMDTIGEEDDDEDDDVDDSYTMSGGLGYRESNSAQERAQERRALRRKIRAEINHKVHKAQRKQRQSLQKGTLTQAECKQEETQSASRRGSKRCAHSMEEHDDHSNGREMEQEVHDSKRAKQMAFMDALASDD